MSDTMTSVETFTRTVCWKCGVVQFVPAHLIEQFRESGAEFYCPTGHIGVFKDSTMSKLRKQVEQLQGRATNLDLRLAEVRAERDHEQRRAAVARGHVTRMKNRVKSGKCVCCGKLFPDVASHMKQDHPEFAEAAKA